MFEFYCFIKELHDETDCNMRIACRLSKFLLVIERALFDEKKKKRKKRKHFEEVQKVFVLHCLKKIINRYFFQCSNGLPEKMMYC